MNLPFPPLSCLPVTPAGGGVHPAAALAGAADAREARRLAALHALQLLDTPPDAELDRITRLAARLLDMPIAAVSLVDAGREWFKSRVGLDVTEMDRALSFCTHTIRADALLVVEDARRDPRFRDNPAVTGAPHVVFYAGRTLYSRGGEALGTLCVAGHAPRTLDAAAAAALEDLAAMAQERLQRLELAQHARSLGQDSARLEFALREAERRYLALFNNRTHGIMHMRMVCDARGEVTNYVIEAVNDAYERLMQRQRGEIEGRLVTEVFPGIERMPEFHFLDPYARVAMAGEEACLERFFPPLGRWYEVYAWSPAHGECISIFTDITARKQAEAERERLLQELEAAAVNADRSRAQLEAVFESIDEGIAVFDMQGNLVMLNRALARINRFASVADMQRHLGFFDRLFELRDARGRRLPLERWPASRVLRGEAFSDWELQVLRHDVGLAMHASYSGAPVFGEDGRQVLGVLVHRDISAGKTLEHELQQAHRELEKRVHERTAALEAANLALRREQQRTRVVLETATDAYVAVDGQDRIIDWNRAAERMFGWRAEEVLGRPVADTLVPMRYRDQHAAAFARLARGQAAGRGGHEFMARHKDGREFPVEISLSANRFEGRVAVSAFLRDISERKRGEEALRRAHDELAQSLAAEQAAARTAGAAKQRAEDAMRSAEAAREAAEEANRAKSDFLATMSHEIRTPLNGVIGFNGLLLDGPLGEDKRHYAELARRSGEALLHLLNDFLDFSKIEAGHLELEPVDFDPGVEAGNALSLVSEQAQKKNLQLDCRLEAPARVRGDAARLRQILLNLLSNAVKFTECGRIRLSCAEIAREPGQVWLAFEVADTGIGINAAARDRLFQPFVQADASTTRRFGGTGLGLAICKRLALAMGGRIGVESELGRGSTFRVELPFAEVPAGAGALPDAAEAPPRVVPESRGRVLVVEDNPVSQLMAAEMLKRLGCRVDVAGNGLEAVEALRRLPYDLIFMDCDMPIMNGFDATRAIRAEERGRRRVPIVAVTASALRGDSERCLAVGMDDFMSKPFRLQDMARMVDAWLRQAPSA